MEPNTKPASGTERKRGWGWYVLASILMLVPVYWQPRVQAGDLSSHIYNAWLTQLIETGRLRERRQEPRSDHAVVHREVPGRESSSGSRGRPDNDIILVKSLGKPRRYRPLIEEREEDITFNQDTRIAILRNQRRYR